jgi:hypothetical protein
MGCGWTVDTMAYMSWENTMGYMIRLVTGEPLLKVVLVVYRVENIAMDDGMWENTMFRLSTGKQLL